MKAKALISFAVTTQLICAFVLAYAKSRFSHDAVQLWITDFAANHGGREVVFESNVVTDTDSKDKEPE